jgi:DNA invertase Pin-like site-specific DNA recombinase
VLGRAGKVLGRPRVEVDIDKLRQLQQNGLSLRRIAAKEGLALSTVVRALKHVA